MTGEMDEHFTEKYRKMTDEHNNSELLPCPFSDKDIKRFEDKYETCEETWCWYWQAATNGKRGYGKIYHNGKLKLAHRFSYELHKGVIPDGLTIDHLCGNRLCVNPEHLEAVPQKVNNLRGNSVVAINKRKTHCANGHSLSGDNISIQRRDDGVRRRCLVCDSEYKKRKRTTPQQALGDDELVELVANDKNFITEYYTWADKVGGKDRIIKAVLSVLKPLLAEKDASRDGWEYNWDKRDWVELPSSLGCRGCKNKDAEIDRLNEARAD